jgi:hypothetical protein
MPILKTRASSVLAIAIAIALSAASASPARAALLSGRVIGPGGTPAPGVDIDVTDAITGERIPTTADTTDADGTFDIVVPNGVFDVDFNAPKPLRLVSRTVFGVIVATTDENMGDVALVAGAVVSGRVIRLSNGAGVANADTDVDGSHTGERIPTPDDDTDGSGNFSVIAPFGTIDFTVEPLKADRLAAWRTIGLAVAGDVNLGNIPLGAGFLVSGTTSGPGGPLPGVDVEAYDTATGGSVPTPDSTSGQGGAYSFVLPAGNYLFKAGAPLSIGTGRSVLVNVAVSGNLSLPISLFSSQLSIAFDDAGRLVDAGTTFRATLRLRNNAGAPRTVRAFIRAVDPRRGSGRDVIAPFDTTIPGSAVIRSGRVSFRIPGSLRPALRGIPFHLVASIVDPTSFALIDSDFLAFQVR